MVRPRPGSSTGGRAGGARASGDPSPITAQGVPVCIKAAANELWGATSLSGLKIDVQGLGNVGMGLCKLLYKSGTHLVVADVDENKTRAATEAFQANVVGVDQVHAATCDVFAPCALGGTLNAGTIPQIQARLVCGAANNQLDTLEDAKRLRAQGVTYAPDFISNAGGICSVASEILNINDPVWLEGKINTLGQTLRRVLAQSADSGETTAVNAERMALDRIEAAAANAS